MLGVLPTSSSRLLNRWAARSKTTLQSLNITHILNAADGPYNINTGAKYYEDLQIEYYGIEAFDDPSFNLSIFFYDAANFISKALNTSGGKREAKKLWEEVSTRAKWHLSAVTGSQQSSDSDRSSGLYKQDRCVQGGRRAPVPRTAEKVAMARPWRTGEGWLPQAQHDGRK